MAPVIKRIIIFLFSLLIIVLLLAGAAKGEDNLRLRLLNSKEMIKQELPLESGNQVIITESQEYPRRTYLFEPIVIFDDYDEVMICGFELSTVDFTGTKIIISLYSALFPNEVEIQNLVRLEGVQLSRFDNDIPYDEMDKLELYPYGMDIIKNNKILVAIERNEGSKFAIVRETTQNFSQDKARVLKDFYKGEFDLHVEFVRGYPVHIPVPNNRYYLSRKIEMIDHCLLELKNNERKANLPKGHIYADAFHRTG